MFTLQREPCRALDSMYETANPTMVSMPAAPVRARVHFRSVVTEIFYRPTSITHQVMSTWETMDLV